MAYNNDKLSRIREPSSIVSVCSKIMKEFRRGIHQIPKLLVLTLVYHLLGNESSRAKCSAAGPVIEIY